jgi:hypothetical protein
VGGPGTGSLPLTPPETVDGAGSSLVASGGPDPAARAEAAEAAGRALPRTYAARSARGAWGVLHGVRSVPVLAASVLAAIALAVALQRLLTTGASRERAARSRHLRRT